MRESMAAFITSQLDFIFFFYGLAFILLGVSGFAIARAREQGEPWAVLGLFGFAHGASEWLDLTALVIGDTPAFAAARIALMTGSFLLLLDFARLASIWFGLKLPGRWIYVPLILLVAIGGLLGGAHVAGATARYAIGFVGATATSLVFARHANAFSGANRHLATFAAVGFALYGIAAGLIVPAAPLWPASQFNYAWFIHLTGIPIQLLRGTLACAIAISIWTIWGQRLVTEVSSERYTSYLRRQYALTLVAMAIILVCGWMLTQFLGGIYKRNIQQEARGNIELLSSRLAGETALVNGMVRALAGTPSVLPLVEGGSQEDIARAKAILDLDLDAAGAKHGYILDVSGRVVASSDRHVIAPHDHFSPNFQKAMVDKAGYHFVFDPLRGELAYYASHPIRAEDGMIIGAAVLEKSLERFAADLQKFARPYFFIDPAGIVVLTNRPDMRFRPLWPLPADKRATLAGQFGRLDDRPILKEEINDASWISLGGERDYVRRRFADQSKWSLVIMSQIREIYASRVLGIIITFLVTMMTLIYLFGRERWVRDRVQMEKRLKLQELARDLRFQATTDALTGLANRLKFNQVLANEVLRSERYKTSLSLVLYDIDHFKRVNDMYGHQVGDKVLVELSRVVAGRIRTNDLLARWGGEEFMLLTPGCDGGVAYQAAEKLRVAIESVMFDQVGMVTCSFGVAEYLEGDTIETFIGRVDEAMYKAKINGRNRVEQALRPEVVEADADIRLLD